MAHYQDTEAWKRSMRIARLVYQLTESFPKSQQYSLSDQMQRAAVSIMSNIAEGWRRTHKEWKNFMRISFGSAAELESQLLLAQSLHLGGSELYPLIFEELDHVSRILNYFTSQP